MQHRLQQVKRLFIRMTLREKLLSLLFILVMLSIWTSSLLKRSSDWNSNRKQAQSDLNIQQHWLDRSDQFAAGLKRALERVDPEKTYAFTQLSGRIDTILRQVSLSQSPTLTLFGLAKAKYLTIIMFVFGSVGYRLHN